MGLRTQFRTPQIAAGKLRHRINIVVASPTQDSAGGVSTTTIVYANVWAAVESITPGNDQLAAGEFTSVTPIVVTMRWIGPAPSWRATTDYLGNALVVDANLNLQIALASGGLSGAVAPNPWNPDINGHTTDGDPSTGVTWNNLGPLTNTKSGVHAGMLVHWNGHILQIKSCSNPDGRNKILLLICTEINDSNQQSSSQGGTGAGYLNTCTPVNAIDDGTF